MALRAEHICHVRSSVYSMRDLQMFIVRCMKFISYRPGLSRICFMSKCGVGTEGDAVPAVCGSVFELH